MSMVNITYTDDAKSESNLYKYLKSIQKSIYKCQLLLPGNYNKSLTNGKVYLGKNLTKAFIYNVKSITPLHLIINK